MANYSGENNARQVKIRVVLAIRMKYAPKLHGFEFRGSNNDL